MSQPGSHNGRAWVLSAALAIGTGAAWAFMGRTAPTPAAPVHLNWAILAVGFVLADLCMVHFEVRDQSQTLTFAIVPLVAGLALCSPSGLMLARLAATGASMGIWRRQEPRKLFFNVSQLALRAALAIGVYHAVLAGASPIASRGWGAALAAAAVSDVTSYVCIFLVIWLTAGRPDAGVLRELLTAAPVAIFLQTSLGLLATFVLWLDPWGAWLLVALCVLFALGYRLYHQLRRRYANLRLLYRFTNDLSAEVPGDQVLGALLRQARVILHAESAQLVMRVPGGIARATSIEDTLHDVLEVRAGIFDEWLLAQDGPRIVPAPEGYPAEAAAERGVTDGLVLPLTPTDGLPPSVMVIANRLGEASAFDGEDLQLAAALASAASLALRNGRLMEALRSEAAANEHQAMHDPLTGLANRSLFTERTELALNALDDRHMVAVMLVDLDNFKEVNDTLGHHVGDRLLQEVAQRLARSAGHNALVARLGGDEFAVVSPSVRTAEDVRLLADAVHDCLDSPVEVDELSLQVRASVGTALAPEHANSAVGLLQRADVAMYTAKASGGGTAVYDATQDRYSRRRLALAGELRQALEDDGLELHYQPQADLVSGAVPAVEALLRWRHPLYGMVPPDEFIPLAEHSGLIAQLTRWVLQRALDDQKAWRQAGHPVAVAVNVSARNLLDATLIDDLNGMLAATGTDPRDLTLELTETAVMSDPTQAARVLRKLSGAGVRISIDDFGTGYSSLSRLTRMPVSEVKIDRSFVQRMVGDEGDRAIVSATAELARALGLSVVAEGIENKATWDALTRLGCRLGQGFVLAEPMPLSDLLRWLEAQAGRPATEESAARVVPMRRRSPDRYVAGT
ncbi:MAG TPA: EAL domain-containing protein [Acidimicrobiales bacterium]|nr:EAL domain-containing protein [Acidimicrobiales bacterium]